MPTSPHEMRTHSMALKRPHPSRARYRAPPVRVPECRTTRSHPTEHPAGTRKPHSIIYPSKPDHNTGTVGTDIGNGKILAVILVLKMGGASVCFRTLKA